MGVKVNLDRWLPHLEAARRERPSRLCSESPSDIGGETAAGP